MIGRHVLVLLLLIPAVLALGVAPPPREVAAKQPPVKVRDVVPPAPLPAPSPGPAKAWLTPGLELDAPQKRTRPGLAFISARLTTAKPDSRVRLIWDVECIWDDETTECEWEIRDGGQRLQIVLPDDSGVVRVSALAIVDGEPASDRLAKTTIEMQYAPRKKAATAAPARPAPQANRGKVTRAIFVIDSEASDPNLVALANSVGLRNRLRAAGVAVEVHERSGAPVALAPYVRDAGGPPAMVLVTSERKVRKATRIPASEEAIVAAVGE